jgi:hypothetical protein
MSGLPKNVRPGEQAGEFIITPDAGKWYMVMGGAALFGFVTSNTGGGFQWIVAFAVAAFAFGMARGQLAWIKVKREGLEYRYFIRHQHYRWDDVSEFKFQSYGIGWNRQQMVVFNNLNKTGVWSNVSKFIGGGTESMPVIGLNAEQLVRILNKARAEYADPRQTQRDPLTSGPRPSAPDTRRAYVPGGAPQTVSSPRPQASPAFEAPRVVRAKQVVSGRRDPIDSRQKPLIS